MKKFVFLFLLIPALFLSGCWTNPSVPAGQVGLVTNEPVLFGEKGEILDVIVGPSSYGLGWANEIKPQNITEYQPTTYKVNYTKTQERDSRILSKDKINMEVSVSAVVSIRESPSLGGDLTKFKTHVKSYMTDYRNAWQTRYKEPFSSYTRETLGSQSYEYIKEHRSELAAQLKSYSEEMLSGSPLTVVSIAITNVNPPQRMLDNEEDKKAVAIQREKQALEQSLQKDRQKVMEQEAENLARALKISPKYLEYKALMLEQKRVEMMNTALTGENSNNIQKMLIPYGTNAAVTVQ